ncbi:MAG: SMP-30/gluconolactonase/LRE family protein [Candidatus Puniceispirillaceae bacterium]
MEPVCVAPTGDICGEAATWDAATGRLYWTDINRFLLHVHDPAAGTTRTHMFDEPVVALSLTSRAGRLLVALGSGLILFNPDTGTREDLAARLAGWPEQRLNDGRSDPRGSFWVGSMANNVAADGVPLPVRDGEGTLYRHDHGGGMVAVETGIGISNTLCWSPDRRHFYFGDTLKNEIRIYPYDMQNGDIGTGTAFFAGFDRGLPDGSAMDSDGYLWNCRFGGGCIVRVAPDGSVDRVIEMPVSNITTCTFGGPDLKTLYVTTAAAEGIERLAGSLFAISVEVAGMEENVFRLG